MNAAPTLAPPQVARTAEDGSAIGLLGRLSDREREVLQQLVDGKSVDHASACLFVSRHTFRTHVKNIRAKVGSHSSLELVALAARAGMRPSSPNPIDLTTPEAPSTREARGARGARPTRSARQGAHMAALVAARRRHQLLRRDHLANHGAPAAVPEGAVSSIRA